MAPDLSGYPAGAGNALARFWWVAVRGGVVAGRGLGWGLAVLPLCPLIGPPVYVALDPHRFGGGVKTHLTRGGGK